MPRLSAQEAKRRHWGNPVPPGFLHSPQNISRRWYGCECELCCPRGTAGRPKGREPKLTVAQAQEKFWGLPVPEHLVHGPSSRSKLWYGCDCKVCLPTGRRRSPHGEGRPPAELQRELRIRMKGQPVPEGKHGTYAYNVYACRCDVCREANRQDGIRQRERKKERQREGRYGDWQEIGGQGKNGVTIVHWPPKTGEPWVCPECDVKIMPRDDA